MDKGRVVHEVRVDLPHPRPRASAALAELEAEILGVIFASGRPGTA
jgi:hypothetical protein